jgi:tRNA pseudouridine-54 N-methylase
MQGIFRKENTDKALKYGIYRHLPTYEKIIRNLVSFLETNYLHESGTAARRAGEYGSPLQINSHFHIK